MTFTGCNFQTPAVWPVAQNYIRQRPVIVRAAQAGLVILSMAAAIRGLARTDTNEVLSTAVQLSSLSGERASQRIPVSITGVVTLSYPSWGGLFFVQDSTAGVFVNNHGPAPALGDLVQVNGVSHEGGF